METMVFKKAKLAAAVTLASGMMFGLTGCLIEGDESDAITTSTTSAAIGNNHQRITAPRGTVVGIVQDTNGNPIAGATVFIGSSSTTTSAGGTYQFNNVAVSELRVTSGNADYTGSGVQIVVVPPTGYLGATVIVKPAAVIDDGEGNQGAGDETSTGSTNTFVDGFTANAGAAVIPALTATVTGWVRDKTSDSHLSMVGETIALDLTDVGANNVGQEQDQNGSATGYQTLSYSAVIQADGSFSIAGVPEDSTLNFVFDDFTINSGATTATTDGEQLATNVGDILVDPITTSDDVAPFVARVENIVNQASSPGLLLDDVSTQIVVKFSEAMTEASLDALTGNSVRIRDIDANTYLTISAMALVGNTLTIDLAAALTPGNTIHVNLLQSDFMDQAAIANHLNTGAGVGFDTLPSSTNSNNYLRLTLKAFSEDATTAPATTTLAQMDEDVLDINANNIELVQAKSTAFKDVDDTTAGIQQLNSNDDDDTLDVAGSDAATRLTALAGVLADTVGQVGASTVATNVARLSFAPTTAATYSWAIQNAAGTLVVVTPIFAQGSDATQLTDNGDGTGTFAADTSGSDFEFVISGVVAGDVVVITPYDELGYAGTPTATTLVDNVAPTTILQTAYEIAAVGGIGDTESDNGQVVRLQFGNGGEQSSTASATVGTPYLNITPRLLGEVDGTADGPVNADSDYIETLVRLYEGNARNSDATITIGTTAPGDQYLDEDNDVYDSIAYTAWRADWTAGNNARTIGVEFSEDVALTATAPTYTPIAVTTPIVPTSFTVNNDVAVRDESSQNGSTTPFSDLIDFDITDVYTFAGQQNGGVLAFEAAITDTAPTPNAGATNASVVMRDMIPALVKTAIYNGQNIIVVFDKSIVVPAGATMTIGTQSISLADTNNYAVTEVVAADGSVESTLTIEPAAWGDDMDMATEFDIGQFKEDDLDFVTLNGENTHGSLDFGKIENVNGANWEEFGADAAKAYYFEEPHFAMLNLVRDFTVPDSATGVGSTATLVYQPTHELSLDAADTDNDGVLESNEIAAMFGTSAVGETVDAGTLLVGSAAADGGVSYTFTLTISAAIVLGTDEITPTSNWLSNYDSNQNFTAAAVTVETP